ncbi:hypothetical protein MSAN_00888300 [Mycena sanguinolenta]|uniref:Uncharacterized protein n=1 Tax=Mycena sanguinolenta TaxID=230812 RepID=A0A8H6YXY1_9AGAR|nr:hypothetical protein MSAN_00888300 [Mycena sanguinolenta]
MGASLSLLTAPKVHVVGLLAAPTLRANKERRRIAEEFAAFRDLFSDAQNAMWLVPAPDWYAESLDLLEPIIDDPDTQSPVITVPLNFLETYFLTRIHRVAEEARERDMIVIVLCGHGDIEPEDKARLVVGGPAVEEYKGSIDRGGVEWALEEAKVPSERVFVLSTSTACCNGRWRSLSWTLLAAADSDPVQATVGTTSTCAAEVEEMQPRDDIYGLLKLLSSSPIRPSTADILERLQIFKPSEPIPRVEAPPLVIRPLSSEEKTLLRDLATAHSKILRPNVSIDIKVNAQARHVAQGKSLSERDERRLLECLRYRKRDSQRATVIARGFGWTNVVPVDRWPHANGLENMMKAEVFGAAIASEFFWGPNVGGALVGGAGSEDGEEKWPRAVDDNGARYMARSCVDSGRGAVSRSECMG